MSCGGDHLLGETMSWKIPLFKIYWDERDIEAASDAIRAATNWNAGPNRPTVENFEKSISEYIESKYCVAFNSGTSALHAILLAHNIKKDSEVIVPSFTFIATANAALFVNAKPVFSDIEEETFGLDVEDVKEKITKKTKAIMPIHYGGSPCLIRELQEVAEDHNLILIEDAAESFGAKIKDKMVGTFGDSAMFSFCQNKIITTGEGGAITTDSKEVYDKLNLIRSHGREEKSNYFSSQDNMEYPTIGYNFRMSDVTAALGISQMEKVDKIISMRRKNAEFMTEKLSNIEGIITPKSPKDYFHVYQMYTIRVKTGARMRDGLMECLAEKGIMSKVYFQPVHLTKYYRDMFGYNKGDLPNTEGLSEQVLSLPMYPTLAKNGIENIAEVIKEYIS